MSATHPSPEQLCALDQGRLQGREADAVEQHLARCLECYALLERLNTDDGLAALIKQAAASRLTPGPGVDETLSLPALDTPVPDAAAAEPSCELPAELIDHPRYRVLRRLGAGGMGVVYLAEHRLMHRPVALKVIAPRALEHPTAIERFRREVAAAACLDHPHIVRAYDSEEAGACHFLVMEFVTGTALDRLIDAKKPLPVARACAYVRQAALGLQHAHEKGMVHRDLKPQNLMLTADGVVKILDFGLARLANALETPAGLTQDQAALGTPDYIAPEQALDARSADIRADIYSLGCTLYHLLSGRPPFSGRSSTEKLAAHLNEEAPPIGPRRPDLPAELAVVLRRTLAKQAADRYQTPKELADALAPFTTDAATASAVLKSRRRRWWHAIVLTAACAAGLVAAGIMVVLRTRHGDLKLDVPPGTTIRQAPNGTVEIIPPAVQPVPPAAPRSLHWKPINTGPGVSLLGHSAAVQSLAFDRDGHLLASGSGDKTLRLWDVKAGKTAILATEARELQCVAFHPAGQALAYGAEAGLLVLRDLSGDRPAIGLTGHTHHVTTLAFSPDGKTLASGSDDRTVRLWEAGNGQLRETLVGHASAVSSVAYHPTRRLLASGETRNPDGAVHLWNTDTGEKTAVLHAITAVSCLAFSPDGARLAIACGDGTIRIWSVAELTEQRRLRGHHGAVHAVAFHPNGRLLASGGADNLVRRWEADTGRESNRLTGHTGTVLAVAFSPSGALLASGGADRTVRLWDVALD